MPEPRRTEWRRLLDQPAARPRLKKAVGALLGAVVVSIGAIGALLIWHASRRARLIRERLSPPRKTHLPDIEPRET